MYSSLSRESFLRHPITGKTVDTAAVPGLMTQVFAEHRRQVRSLLGLIRAIVVRTARSSESVSSYVDHLSGRIDALARVQEILMREPASGIDLQELLADELMRQGVDAGSLDVSSRSLMLDSKVAAALAMALHELTTNAIKFGELDNPARRIHVYWTETQDGWVNLHWREDGSMNHPPSPVSGFGFELIRRTLPYEIGGRTRIELTPAGLACEITFRPDGVAC